MDTSYLRDQLAQHVAGEVYAGSDAAAATETAAFNTASRTGRPSWSRRAPRRTSRRPCARRGTRACG